MYEIKVLNSFGDIFDPSLRARPSAATTSSSATSIRQSRTSVTSDIAADPPGAQQHQPPPATATAGARVGTSAASKGKTAKVIKTAVVTVVGNTARHPMQFLTFLHPSWQWQATLRTVRPSDDENSLDVQLDLFAFCEFGTCDTMPLDCRRVEVLDDLLKHKFGLASDTTPRRHIRGRGQCFYVPLPESYTPSFAPRNSTSSNSGATESDMPYRFLGSLRFLSDEPFRELVLSSGFYDYVLRTDVDAVLGPGARTWIPPYGVAAGKGFMGEPTVTYPWLERIAKGLGYDHIGIHGMQSTFYVHIEMARPFVDMLTNLTTHFYVNEFTADTCHRLNHDPLFLKAESEHKHKHGACRWPYWYKGVASLFAQDLTMNHIMAPVLLKAARIATGRTTTSVDPKWAIKAVVTNRLDCESERSCIPGEFVQSHLLKWKKDITFQRHFNWEQACYGNSSNAATVRWAASARLTAEPPEKWRAYVDWFISHATSNACAVLKHYDLERFGPDMVKLGAGA